VTTTLLVDRNHSFPHGVRIWTLLIACSVTPIMIFIYQPVRIEGSSMAPLLADRDAIFVNRMVYRLAPIQRGDVVVFDYPLDRRTSFIKRIVALPGETIEIRQGLVYVNGNWLPEPYVPSQYCDLSDFGPLKVPSDSYFVMGDHRSSSNDSRAFGTVATRLIQGRAVLAYWPVSHFGSLSATASTQAKNK
jgi:signal peptidase I